MIRAIAAILLLSIFFSCDDEFPEGGDSNILTSKDKPNLPVPWYAGKDTADAGEVVACAQGYFYKKLDSSKVLLIRYTDPVYNDTTINLDITNLNSSQYTELYFFNNDSASIRNFCNDAPSHNYEPQNSFTNAYGTIIIKFKQPSKANKLNNTEVSIYVKELTFVDPGENKVYVIKNRIYWKITNWEWYPG